MYIFTDVILLGKRNILRYLSSFLSPSLHSALVMQRLVRTRGQQGRTVPVLPLN